MTSYFDTASRAVSQLPKDVSDETYLSLVAEIEKPIVQDVLLNTGDREFPDDLREKIVNVIAVKGIYSPAGLEPTPSAREYVLMMHYSELVSDLHSAFHALAGRRIQTRFGSWSDSPRGNLVSRKCHDEPDMETDEQLRQRLAERVPPGAAYTAEDLGNASGEELDALAARLGTKRETAP
jgi:hypothetical protein